MPFYIYIFFGLAAPADYPQWKAVLSESESEFADIDEAEAQMNRLQERAEALWKTEHPDERKEDLPRFRLMME